MAFSGRSRDFLSSLKLGRGYIDSQRKYINSLNGLLGKKISDNQKQLDENFPDEVEGTLWSSLLGFLEIAGGVGGALFTGGATIPVAVDGVRRLGGAIEDFDGLEGKYEKANKELNQINETYSRQVKSLKSNFDISKSNYEEALFNVGADIQLMEVRLDKEAARLEQGRASSLSGVRQRRLTTERNLDLINNALSSFTTQNNIAVRKINDEFSTYFRSFVNEKEILSGYKEAAIDSAESSNFFTGLDVNTATQKTLTTLDETRGSESSENKSNRLLNNAGRVLSELNLAQDKAFQQRYKTSQSLVNQLLQIQSRENQQRQTLDLRAIGLRAGTEQLESQLLSKIKETEIQDNYFNNILTELDKTSSLINNQFTQGLSILERSYALALESAKKRVDFIHQRAGATLDVSFNNLASRIEQGVGIVSEVSFDYSQFGDTLANLGQTAFSAYNNSRGGRNNQGNQLNTIDNLFSEESPGNFQQNYSELNYQYNSLPSQGGTA